MGVAAAAAGFLRAFLLAITMYTLSLERLLLLLLLGGKLIVKVAVCVCLAVLVATGESMRATQERV